MLEVASFAEWREVSAVMAPHYLDTLSIEPGSALAERVAEMKAASADPLARAALATQLVQDDISYLANGMDGGNYIPQSAMETWQQRYGDCKAKSVLLIAMLHAMDIEAEPLLVQSRGGDAVPELLPMAGGFDHVIAHALIGGESYFLDGTTAGTRLANITTVPPFRYGLPLREAGAELFELPARLPQSPNMTLKLTIDSSAGVAVPAIYALDLVLAGESGAPVRAMAGQIEGKILEQAVGSLVYSALGETQLLTTGLTYDDQAGVAHVTATGLMTTPWKREQEIYRLSPPGQPAAELSIEADRARQLARHTAQAAGPWIPAPPVRGEVAGRRQRLHDGRLRDVLADDRQHGRPVSS